MSPSEKFDADQELANLAAEASTFAIVERFDDDGENRGVFFIEITEEQRPHLTEIVQNFTRDFLKDEGRFLTLANIPADALKRFTSSAFTDRITFEWKGESDMDELEICYYRFGNESLFFR